MAEYIDRASLINNLITFAPEHYTSLLNDLILKEPAADVVERRKGKWQEYKVIDIEDTTIEEVQSQRCSVCRRYLTTPYLYYFEPYNFCPNCGADMREEN